MKKLITIILILAMLLRAAALADLPDISGLSNDELLELREKIQLQLFSSKLVDGITVPPGEYIIGEDIPEGSYRVCAISLERNSMVIIYSAGKNVLTSYAIGDLYGAYEVGKLPLENGMIIEVDFAPVIFYPYAGLFN